TRVDVSTSGAQCQGTSEGVSITNDGQWVAFSSGDTVTLDGTAGNHVDEDDAYVHDLMSGKTLRVEVGEDGKPLPHLDYEAVFPEAAAQGRFVAFAWDDAAGARTLYVYDSQAGKSRRVVLDGWDPLEGFPSDDGKRVLFVAEPSTPGPTIQFDVFIGSR